MTTLTLLDAIERPAILEHRERDDDVPGRGGPTLDDLVSGAWEGLLAAHTAPCPVCAGTLAPRYGAGPGPVGARCTSCGSELS